MKNMATRMLLVGFVLTAGWMVSQTIAQPRAAGKGRVEPGPEAREMSPFHLATMQIRAKELEFEEDRLESLREQCFDPEVAGLLGIGAIRESLEDRPADAVALLEDVLKETRSLGLRNAIRLTLRDEYVRLGRIGELGKMLRQHIAENDAAILADDDEDDDDDEDGDDDDEEEDEGDDEDED
jgi:hypothetical protein